MPKLLSVADAAKFLGLTTWQTRALLWDGVLPYRKVGRWYYLAVDDLEKWVRDSATTAGN